LKPEAGWHPSNPVVERSWDAVFIAKNRKDLKKFRAFLNFLFYVPIIKS
jgi:hypothetical protein